jgi:hypothetical protein
VQKSMPYVPLVKHHIKLLEVLSQIQTDVWFDKFRLQWCWSSTWMDEVIWIYSNGNILVKSSPVYWRC